MRVTVSNTGIANSICYMADFTPDESGEYRARLFVFYDGYNTFSGDFGYGITVDTPSVTYDDWCGLFRPPRIDAHKFNTEINVGLEEGLNKIGFIGTFSRDSESYISSDTNPMNFLVERKVGEAEIRRIHVTDNAVYLDLDLETEIDDGIAVTIGNRSLSERHLLGEDGLRICGTYQLTHVSGTVYKYNIGHYKKIDNPIDIDPSGYTLSIWEACYYEADDVRLYRESTESASFNFTTLGWGYKVPFAVGDELCISNSMCRIVKIDGFSVYVAAELSESVMTVNIKCCPRVPSKDIAVNWPHIVYAVTRSRTDDVVISNSPNYRHTRNTEYVYPMTDTYFVNNDESVNHDNETVLTCSTGDIESVACMQFAANTIKNTDTSTAELQLYVDRMNYSESTLIVYQMTTSAWSPSMTYQQVSQYISGIPIGTYQLKNPTLGDYNSAAIVERLPEDDYHSLITIPISSSVMAEWLSGDGTYTPSIAIRIIGDGDQSVSFVSTSGNSEYTPRICLTGGESGAHPVPFEIHLSSDIIEPGNILRITPGDPTINSFGNSIFNLEVDINDTLVTIENGDSSYLDVLVPDTLSGVVNVYVKQKGGDRLTDDATVYVDASNVNRNVALAKKLKPGVIDPHKVNSTALYNRDMGFVDMTEVTDETSLIQNVYMILLTNPGERLFSQDFGTGIEQKLFKLGSVEEGISLLQECIRKVSIYEPRVYIDGDQSTCEFDNSLNHYTLILCCVLPTGHSEYIKLPFKNRGTVI